ncbi:hypothetical protein [Faecalispora jeddahensis]|uniref:hypothetical protein n=1 Tax=Faecalispora jeddahensis TaxID=1414721 RepID=UPI001898F269|nr:hypothetical protein [Faecalispora jeddahensis]
MTELSPLFGRFNTLFVVKDRKRPEILPLPAQEKDFCFRESMDSKEKPRFALAQ